jgi:putative solute:sodium symporter small subunit
MIQLNIPIKKGEKMDTQKAQAYWKENISTILKLLVVWFIVSYGCGILFINELNSIEISGVKLGFWFAQQGAIYFFVLLIFVYVGIMNKIDEKYEVNE